MEIYQKAGARCTEYNHLRAALKCVDDKFIEDMKKYIDAKCKYSDQWNKTHDVRYHWKAEDAERQALENKCKSVGAFTVLEKITELSDKYYKLKMQAYRVMQGRGWL